MTRADPLYGVERAAVAEEVAGSIRHDLRNKIAGIRSALFYVRGRVAKTDVWESDERMPRFFGYIDSILDKAEDLLAEGATLGHLFGADARTLKAQQVLDRAIECARVDESVRFESDSDDSSVYADPQELALALRCLLENAAEATADTRGVVRVAASSRSDGRLAFEVRDEGQGIAGDDRHRVLDAFYTTKPGHAGLGLNIAKRVAHRYGGDLVIEEVERGGSVTVLLPAAGARAEGA